MDGDGNFNWRMVFPFDYMPIEKKIVVRKKVIGCFQIFFFYLLRAVFKWLSENQNQSNYCDQSQRQQTARWTNQNS